MSIALHVEVVWRCFCGIFSELHSRASTALSYTVYMHIYTH